MALDFPTNPAIGAVLTSGGYSWTWDGTKWKAGNPTVAWLPIAGGTMTGDLVLNRDPVIPLGAATKQTVDARAAGENRIINGDMRVNQRGVASGTAINGYTVDRWRYGASVSKGTWQRIVGGPPGFPYSFLFTSSSAYAVAAADYFYVGQIIEADNVSDFQWGTANAQPVTLSFWASSNKAGTYSGVVQNVAATRSYPFTFALTSAWTKVAVTIPGDTAGTWVMSGNGGSVFLLFDFGTGTTYRGPANVWAAKNYVGATGTASVVATNGATFYLSGVKLEIGNIATPFPRQSPARSLADCQRYYQQIGGATYANIIYQGYSAGAGMPCCYTVGYSVSMRIVPGAAIVGNFTANNTGTIALFPGLQCIGIQMNPPAAGGVNWYNTDATGFVTLDAEL